MRWFLWIFFSLLLAGSVAAADRPSESSPRVKNVVLILADDLGFGDLSCYRRDAGPTPHCDRLAREGLRLTDAHSASAVCTPTRYSVLTGRYPWRSYLQNWVLAETMPLLIEAGTPTLPETLQQGGMRTGVVGKWHLGWGRDNGAFQRGEYAIGPTAVGFDDVFAVPFSHNSTESMQVFVATESMGAAAGSVGTPAIVGEQPRSLEDTATDLSAAATGFIEESAVSGQPFFLYYPTTNVHFPITPHSRFVTGDERASLATIEGDSLAARRERDRIRFAGFVREFDWAVGQVLDALDRAGVADETLVVVTSDNGGAVQYGSSNDPWRGSKTQIYEGGHRVPWIVRGPGLAAGETSDLVACTTDLTPTLLAAVGQPCPFEVDGVSLWDAWTGAADETELAELAGRPIVLHSVAGMFALRQGRLKLVEGLGPGTARWGVSLRERPEVEFFADGRVKPFSFRPAAFPQPAAGEPAGQLYDLVADPKEATNLWGTRPDQRRAMLAMLEAIREGRE